MIIEKTVRYQCITCKRCSYSWQYGGKSIFVCSCPRCKTTISLNSNKKKTSGEPD